MTDFRVNKPALKVAALLMVGGLVAGCGTSSPDAINYKSDSRSKQASLAVPPNLLEETADQRSLPPQGGQTSLSDFQQVQKVAPSTPTVIPPVSGMHIQRDGTERWLVIDSKSPEQVWPQIRRFWQEQGFLLVVDARNKGVMETDWNETHPQISDGLIRNTLSMATGNSYVAAERNKYRTRLEVAPDGGTYVFVSQKGMREALTGTNNDSSQWQAKPNDPALEGEYLKRLMAALALADARQASGQSGTSDLAAVAHAEQVRPRRSLHRQPRAAAKRRDCPRRRRSRKTRFPKPLLVQITLPEPYDRAWLRVGLALDRTQFHCRRPRSRPWHLLRPLRRSQGHDGGGAGLLEPGVPRQERKASEELRSERARDHGNANARIDHRQQRGGRLVLASTPDHGLARRPIALNANR